MPRQTPEACVAKIIRDICELPDRTSPDDQPDMLLVTTDELDAILTNAITARDAEIAEEAARDREQLVMRVVSECCDSDSLLGAIQERVWQEKTKDRP